MSTLLQFLFNSSSIPNTFVTLRVTGTNIDLTDSLTTPVEETFEGVLGKFQNLKISNNVYLEVSKNAANPLHTCETTMTIENGPTIRSKSSR